MDTRLALVIDYLSGVKPGAFRSEVCGVPEYAGISAIQLSPITRAGASVRLTDTGVTVYVEILGARWEADSSDEISNDGMTSAGFDAHLRWAAGVVYDVAEYGMVRVRSRWCIFGAQTHLLRSSMEAQEWTLNPQVRVVRCWDPW